MVWTCHTINRACKDDHARFYLDSNGSPSDRVCYNCDRVVSPVDCETVITCGADQQCFTDKYVTDENHVLYNLGCKMNKVCSLMAQLGRRDIEDEDSPLDKRNIIHLCTKCCNAGYCNNKLCTDVTTPVPALRCYACNDLESLSACETLKNCEPDEECFAETWFTDMHEIRHHLGCRRKQICDIISMHNTNTVPHGKRQQGTHLCNGCCNSSFCNIAGCQNITNKHFG
ncbi:hypothetical protein ACJMK2_039647 [Sinanodonta woodiana]|uniref:UPAR/Ly6 domain-containing protein n=1 Tax=Sinanodonta woodiana TaxID=1069815 RepID=A0ABD3WG23_SINWO